MFGCINHASHTRMNTLVQKLIFPCIFLLSGAGLFARSIPGFEGSNADTCFYEVTVPLCPNQTFTVDGIPYAGPYTVYDTLHSAVGSCDTIIAYKLTIIPYNKGSKTIKICPGETVVIDGIAFSEPGIYVSNNPSPSTNGGCDTLFTYHFVFAFQPSLLDTVILTPGESVVIAGNSYTAPAVVDELIPATTGCDTLLQHVLLLDLTFPDTCSKTLTFLKTIGQTGVPERGSVICPASDGNFYLGGERGNQSLMVKVTPDGKVLWSHVFQPVAGRPVRITDLIEDSDGMLVGCGIVHPDTISPEAYAFRFNPQTGSLMWSRYLKQAKPEAFAIVERSPGGSFLLLVSPQLVSNVDDAEIWELSRSNGTLAGAIGHFNFGVSDVWNSAVLYNGALYAAGRHIPGPITVPAPLHLMQTGLSKIDLAGGTAVWSRLGTAGIPQSTTLYGTDLVVNGDGIAMLSAGFDSLGNNQRSAFFLQKNTLDGALLWQKRYSIPGYQNVEAHDIQQLADGYLLSGQARAGMDGWDKIIVKTDPVGHVLWARQLVSGTYDSKPGQFFIHNHQMAVRNNALYLTAFTEEFPSDLLLLKMTLDGDVSDSCGYVQPIDVQATVVGNPSEMPIQVDMSPFVVASFNAPATVNPVSLQAAALCLRCCEPIQLAESATFCPGESVTIGGVQYTQSGTVTDTIAGIIGCDTIVTYTLTLLPQPTRTELLEFCPGESVTIGGNTYTQPGAVIDTLAATIGCDTIVTYTLQFIDPSGGALSVDCPDNLSIAINAGTGPVAVQYDLPTADSDCECPGIALALTQGLAPGALFPAGLTTVCYQAKDNCGNITPCCFEVFVREESPCDSKTAGCLKWELLDINRDADNDLIYRIRVTNTCANKMIYTAIQMPNGLTALAPANNSVYTAPGGRQYDVRNPNYSPFYSIRFKSQTDSIANGESDVFEYTLPGQTLPNYIHVTARLAPQISSEAYLNTFNCPVGAAPGNRPVASREQPAANFEASTRFTVFPNPTTGLLFADLSAWQGESLQLQVFNSQGQRLQNLRLLAGEEPQVVHLPEGLSGGLYFVEIISAGGERQSLRFVLQH